MSLAFEACGATSGKGDMIGMRLDFKRAFPRKEPWFKGKKTKTFGLAPSPLPKPGQLFDVAIASLPRCHLYLLTL